MLQKQPLVQCGECKKKYYFLARHKHLKIVDREIIHIGTECPHCGKWLHVAFLTQELLKRQTELKNHRQVRAFKRDFDALQVEIEELLKMTQQQKKEEKKQKESEFEYTELSDTCRVWKMPNKDNNGDLLKDASDERV